MSLIMSQERGILNALGYVETSYDDKFWHQLHITEDTEGPTEEAASVDGVKIWRK